jgi:ketosteroid isomerase-like protein
VNETETVAPHAILERLIRAWNGHDIEAFVDCFHPEYRSDQPAHPARSFEGNDQVRANWSEVFAGIPDFVAELLSFAEQGERVWAEWLWTGTQKDGTPFEWRGVTLFGMREGRIGWARLYMEPVEEAGADIAQVVHEMASGGQSE